MGNKADLAALGKALDSGPGEVGRARSGELWCEVGHILPAGWWGMMGTQLRCGSWGRRSSSGGPASTEARIGAILLTSEPRPSAQGGFPETDGASHRPSLFGFQTLGVGAGTPDTAS